MVVVTLLSKVTKNHRIVHLKWVNFMTCKIYLSKAIKQKREFPGGPVLRIPCFHCQGPEFNPWSGTKIPQAAQRGQGEIKKRERERK